MGSPPSLGAFFNSCRDFLGTNHCAAAEVYAQISRDVLGLPVPLNRSSQLKLSFFLPFNPILPSFDEDALIPRPVTQKVISLPDLGQILDFRE